MTASLSGVFSLQEFSDLGTLLVGGRLYTYTQGTTTLKTAYTDAAGSVAHTYTADGSGGFYIALNARGELPAPLYLTTGSYDIALKTAAGATIWTRRADPVADGPAAALAAYVASIAAAAGSALVGFIQAATGAIADTVQSALRQRISLLDFIPPALKPAILNYTSTDDHTAYILAAFAAANGRELIVPAGLYNHHELTYAKTKRFHLRGDMSGYDNTVGVVWNFTPTGTSIGLQIGVDDGSPDSTGPIRDVVVEGITFSTATGATAIRVQNTGLCRIEHNSFNLFSGKVIDCRANVLLKILNNDIRGFQPASGNYGIWLDAEYFGNFVTEISGNHIYQVNWLIRFSQGRSVKVTGNTFENIRGWTLANPGFGGMFLFATSGYISSAIFENNYCESQRGWCFYSDPLSPFTGAILNLVVRQNEFWGSGDATNQNPGWGNLPRGKVGNHIVDANFVVDATANTAYFLALPANSYFPNTFLFDQTTTILNTEADNQEYEDALVYAMRPNELLKTLGDFGTMTGGAAGSMTIAGGVPTGWTSDITGSTLNLIADAIQGTFVVNTAGSGTTFNLFHAAITCPNVAYVTNYALAFTGKGWLAAKVNGTTVFDSGASVAAYTTEFVTFTVAANSSSFTLQFATNASNAFSIAEARCWQVGSAETANPGPAASYSLVIKAARRLMKRGAY